MNRMVRLKQLTKVRQVAIVCILIKNTTYIISCMRYYIYAYQQGYQPYAIRQIGFHPCRAMTQI
jgi:hypothetical protein